MTGTLRKALSSLAALARRPPAAGEVAGPTLTLRTERWTRADGDETFLVAIAFGSCCAVYGMRVDAADGRLWWICGLFHEGAILSFRDALAEAACQGRAGRDEVAAMRLFDGMDWVDGAFPDRLRQAAHTLAERAGHRREVAYGARPRTVHALAEAPGPLAWILWGERRDPPDAWQDGFPRLEIDLGSHGDVLNEHATIEAFDRFLGDWHAALSERARPAGLPPGGWARFSYDLMEVDRRRRVRRAQAFALQPLLVAEIAGSDGLLALIDAGAPFEDALARLVLGDDFGDRDGRARIRRLRSFPRVPDPGSREPICMVQAAKRLPLERLPTDAAGWERYDQACQQVVEFAVGYGLDLSALMAGLPRDWGIRELTGMQGGDRDVQDRARRHVLDIDDVVEKFRQTVLDPARRLGVDPDPEGRGMMPTAAGMLYAGRTMRKVLQLSWEWHGGLPRLNEALPASRGRADRAWRPLFAPIAGEGGIVLRCLTDEGALRDEGRTGSDGDGIGGLAHCVGGYGDRCVGGATHVVSVSVGADGSRRRLSTAQIDWADGQATLVQHRGPRNDAPPPEAVRAVAGLLDSLRGGVVPLWPEGREPVPARAPEQDAPYDLAAAVAAWRPYLTAAGLRRCGEMVAALAER